MEISAIVHFNINLIDGYKYSTKVKIGFKAIAVKLSKLKEGDLLEITHVVLNYPLVILSAVRDGVNMGRFTAGRVCLDLAICDSFISCFSR